MSLILIGLMVVSGVGAILLSKSKKIVLTVLIFSIVVFGATIFTQAKGVQREVVISEPTEEQICKSIKEGKFENYKRQPNIKRYWDKKCPQLENVEDVSPVTAKVK